MLSIDQAPQALLSFLASLRPKRFAEQNLGADEIHFRRAREIRKGSRKIEDFVGMRRESGVPSVLRSKTLAQAEFIFAEQEKSERAPAKSKILHRRESFVPSVLRSKTLAQAEFISAEQEKSERAPAKSKILWESLTPTGKETCRGR